MKHSFSVTAFLLIVFFLSQVLGLFLMSEDITITEVEGELTAEFEETAIGERPDFEGIGSLLYLVIGIGIGTALLFVLIRMRFGKKLWKVWYALAVMVAISVAVGVFVSPELALLIGFVLMVLKLKLKHFISHNITEMLMYAGLALLLVPLFDIFWAFMLLIVISLYDAYAVWKSKHMVQLAKFTTESKLFAGLLVNYKEDKKGTKFVGKTYVKNHEVSPKMEKIQKKYNVPQTPTRQAILGGGDVVFPLIFSGVVLTSLLLNGYGKLLAIGLTLITSLLTTLALFLLFKFSVKDKFYPAMPFISAGCFVGYGILQLVLLLL